MDNLNKSGEGESSHDLLLKEESIVLDTSKFKLESLIESNKSMSKSGSIHDKIPELSYPVLGKFTGIFAKLDSMSTNKRFYSKAFWNKVLNSAQVKSDLKAGRMKGIYEHPNIKSDFTDTGLLTARHPSNAAFVVKRLWIEGDHVMGEGYILHNPMGKLLATYFLARDEAGVPLFDMYISARGYSREDYIDENGVDIMNPEDYFLQAFDIVTYPGIAGAKVKLESADPMIVSKLEKLESFSHEVRQYYVTESIKKELRDELGLLTV